MSFPRLAQVFSFDTDFLPVGMIWAFLHAMRVGFNTMKAVLAVEMGLLRA